MRSLRILVRLELPYQRLQLIHIFVSVIPQIPASFCVDITFLQWRTETDAFKTFRTKVTAELRTIRSGTGRDQECASVMCSKGERITSRKRSHTGAGPHIVDEILGRRREARYGGEGDCLAGGC